MEFTLESENDLGDNSSLLPLWLFSKLLLDVDGLNEYCINKRFLKPVVIKRLSMDHKEVELNDKEVLKSLIDIYMIDKNQSPFMNPLNKEIKMKINDLLKDYLIRKE